MTLPIQPDQRHIKQAEHNSDLLHESCFPDPCVHPNPEYKDWTATIAFYIALHYVQAYLHRKGFKTIFKNHFERNDYLKNDASVKDARIARVLVNYLSLYKLSRNARYTACSFHYMRTRDLCHYFKFALNDLPKMLGLP